MVGFRLNITMEGLRKLWVKWKATVDWFDANARYFTAVLRILTSRWVLGLLVGLGMLGPQTADDLKQALLGNDLAETVEVVDNVQ